jgi:hypothetical protein
MKSLATVLQWCCSPRSNSRIAVSRFQFRQRFASARIYDRNRSSSGVRRPGSPRLIGNFTSRDEPRQSANRSRPARSRHLTVSSRSAATRRCRFRCCSSGTCADMRSMRAARCPCALREVADRLADISGTFEMGGVSAAPDREGLELVNDRSAPLRDPSDRRVDGGHVTRGDVLTAANSACNKRAQRLLDGNRRIAVRTGLPPTGIVPEPSPCAYPSASSTGRSFPLGQPATVRGPRRGQTRASGNKSRSLRQYAPCTRCCRSFSVAFD